VKYLAYLNCELGLGGDEIDDGSSMLDRQKTQPTRIFTSISFYDGNV